MSAQIFRSSCRPYPFLKEHNGGVVAADLFKYLACNEPVGAQTVQKYDLYVFTKLFEFMGGEYRLGGYSAVGYNISVALALKGQSQMTLLDGYLLCDLAVFNTRGVAYANGIFALTAWSKAVFSDSKS